jgi:hypothetical protein
MVRAGCGSRESYLERSAASNTHKTSWYLRYWHRFDDGSQANVEMDVGIVECLDKSAQALKSLIGQSSRQRGGANEAAIGAFVRLD